MLSAVIATHDSERSLVPTLSALVPGATAGLVAEVIIADANSQDATAEVADIAGCRYVVSDAPVGTRLKSATRSVRTPWLLFLRPGTVLDHGWVDAAHRFIDVTETHGAIERAAVFRPPGIDNPLRPGFADILALLRVVLGGRPKPDQGLLLPKRFYDALGGHDSSVNAEDALLAKIGRRRTAMLAAVAWPPRATNT